jgi:hypothetical protein
MIVFLHKLCVQNRRARPPGVPFANGTMRVLRRAESSRPTIRDKPFVHFVCSCGPCMKMCSRPPRFPSHCLYHRANQRRI